jgi:hypothetical protein
MGERLQQNTGQEWQDLHSVGTVKVICHFFLSRLYVICTWSVILKNLAVKAISVPHVHLLEIKINVYVLNKALFLPTWVSNTP